MLSTLVLATAISVMCECEASQARTYEAARIRLAQQCSVFVVEDLEVDPLDCNIDGRVDVGDLLCFNAAVKARIFESSPSPEETP